MFHVEQFGANGNGFGEVCCKSLIPLRIHLRKIMAICALLQRMGIFRVERRKLLSNFVGRRGSLYRLRTFVKSHLSRKDKGAAKVGHPGLLFGREGKQQRVLRFAQEDKRLSWEFGGWIWDWVSLSRRLMRGICVMRVTVYLGVSP